jgi:diadenosine tetraphosphate (Ap4A) HIT family hydrolase
MRMSPNSAPKSADCILCGRLSTPIVRENRFWRTALNPNQNLLGKLIVVLRRHEEDVTLLSAEEWLVLHEQVAWAVARLRAAFAPDHFNYAFLQNQDRHIHLHVIPRYAGPRAAADIEFTDPDYPEMFRVRSNMVAPAVLAALAGAITTGGP